MQSNRENKPETEVLRLVREDLSLYQSRGIPAIIHPMRALSLARTIAGVPAALLAEAMGVSRSYLALLENYGKPVTEDIETYMQRLTRAAKQDEAVSRVMSNYEALLPVRWFTLPELLRRQKEVGTAVKIRHLLNYTTSMEKGFTRLVRGDILSYALLEAVSVLGKMGLADVVWESASLHPETNETPLAPWWPKGHLPRTILATPKSFLVAWVGGLLTTDQLVSWYAAAKQPPPVILADWQHRAIASDNAMAALAMFLFMMTTIKMRFAIPGPAAALVAFCADYEIESPRTSVELPEVLRDLPGEWLLNPPDTPLPDTDA
ncbi:MAG: hypothetical protein ACPLPT_10630 [Moorellales bacterium]